MAAEGGTGTVLVTGCTKVLLTGVSAELVLVSAADDDDVSLSSISDKSGFSISSKLKLVPAGTVLTLGGNFNPCAFICANLRSVGTNLPSFQAS